MRHQCKFTKAIKPIFLHTIQMTKISQSIYWILPPIRHTNLQVRRRQETWLQKSSQTPMDSSTFQFSHGPPHHYKKNPTADPSETSSAQCFIHQWRKQTERTPPPASIRRRSILWRRQFLFPSRWRRSTNWNRDPTSNHFTSRSTRLPWSFPQPKTGLCRSAHGIWCAMIWPVGISTIDLYRVGRMLMPTRFGIGIWLMFSFTFPILWWLYRRLAGLILLTDMVLGYDFSGNCLLWDLIFLLQRIRYLYCFLLFLWLCDSFSIVVSLNYFDNHVSN